jgi:hypothetical protein
MYDQTPTLGLPIAADFGSAEKKDGSILRSVNSSVLALNLGQ